MPEGNFGRLTAGLWRVARAVDSVDTFIERRGGEQAFWSRFDRLVTFPACVEFHPFGAASAWSVALAKSDPRDQPTARRGVSSPLPGRETEVRGESALDGGRSGARVRRLDQALRNADSERAAPELALRARASRPRPEPSPPNSAGVSAGLSRLRELVGVLEPRNLASPSAESTHRSAEVSTGLRPESAKRPLPSPSSPKLAPRFGRSESAGALRRATQPAAAASASWVTLLERYVATLAPSSPASSSREAEAKSAAPSRESAAPSGSSPANVDVARRPVPRAASLLLGAPSASSSRPATELDSPERANGSEAALERGAGGDDGADDDALLERLNHALVEQAWLRGVDLT